LFYDAVLGSQEVVADGDHLSNSWIDSYLHADQNMPAVHRRSDWVSEFTKTRRHPPPHQFIPVEHRWAQDLLDQREHDVW